MLPIETPASGPPRRWGCRRWAKAAGLSILGLFAAFYGAENGRGAYAWSRAQARLAAAGESLDLRKFDPPRIPPDENFCATPALAGVGGDDEPTNAAQKRLTDLDFDRHRRRSPPYIRQPQLTRDPPDWEEWRSYLEASTVLDIPQEETDPAKAIALGFAPHAALFEELIQAARDRPHAKFEPPLYSNDNRCGMIGKLEGPSPVMILQTALTLKARACLAAGDVSSAGQLFHVSWRLHEAHANEVYRPVGALAGVATYRSHVAPVLLDGLRLRVWNEQELIKWEGRLAAIDLRDQSLRAIRWEVADAVDFIDRLLADRPSAMEEWCDNSRGRLSATFDWIVRLSPRGWFRQHQAFAVNEFLDHMLPPLRDSGLLAWQKSETRRRTEWEEGRHPHPPYSLLLGISIQPNFFPRYLLHADMDGRLLRTACALERYYLRSQKYPDSLAALRPDFLAEIPSDLDSQPLRYARDETNGRYRLWSVGENLVDDWRGQPPPERGAKAGRRPPSPEQAMDWVLSFPPSSP